MDPHRKNKTTFSSLTTHWHNQSRSSILSDAGTFHSAQGQLNHPAVELSLLQTSSPSTCTALVTEPLNNPEISKMESTQMSRKDSGFSDGLSSRRTSTSSTRRHRSSKCTTTTSISRPAATRAARSHPTPTTTRHSITSSSTSSSSRPHIRTRHTINSTPSSSQLSNQFFHFPSLPPPPTPIDPIPEPIAIPPVTCQYWTSDSTRRLEYAAIDAASRGVKGFFIKLVPDCILPLEKRRPRFHEDDGDDVGSVRRYRLDLPEEKAEVAANKNPGFLKRWTGFGRAGSS